MPSPFILPLTQFTGIDGLPLSGWTVEFFDADTKVPLIAYKDVARKAPFGPAIRADSHGILPPFWLVPTGLKCRAKIGFPDGRDRWIEDLQLAAPDAVASTAKTFASPSLPTLIKSGTSIVIAPEDFGSLVTIPAGSDEVSALLPRPRDVPSGRILAVRNSSTNGGLVALHPASADDGVFPGIPAGATLMFASNGNTYDILVYTPPLETLVSGPKRNLVFSARSEYPSGTKSLTAFGSTPTTLTGTTNTGTLTWIADKLNTVLSTSIPGAGLTSNQITLPGGSYHVRYRRKFSGAVAGACVRWQSKSSSIVLPGAPIAAAHVDKDDDVWAECHGFVKITGTETFEPQFILLSPTSTDILGRAVGLSGVREVYAEVDIIALATE
jgi:hypothetical protein